MTSYADAVAAVNARIPDLEPDLAALYTLLVLVKGEDTMLRDVHDAWSLWRVGTVPDHPYLVPFDDLSTDVQMLDVPFRDAIREVSEELHRDAAE